MFELDVPATKSQGNEYTTVIITFSLDATSSDGENIPNTAYGFVVSLKTMVFDVVCIGTPLLSTRRIQGEADCKSHERQASKFRKKWLRCNGQVYIEDRQHKT
eukprot:1195951-Prorocentrum_minimum.AAC.3